jgi:hypothetical protein
LIVGFLVLFLIKVGFFLIGALAGLCLSSLLLGVLTNSGTHLSQGAQIGITVVLAILTGIVTLWRQRFFISFATSLAGAVLFFMSLDVFARTGWVDVVELQFQDFKNGNPRFDAIRQVSKPIWGMVAGTIVMFLLTLTIQMGWSRRSGREFNRKDSY